jgi:hypothetical protein
VHCLRGRNRDVVPRDLVLFIVGQVELLRQIPVVPPDKDQLLGEQLCVAVARCKAVRKPRPPGIG